MTLAGIGIVLLLGAVGDVVASERCEPRDCLEAVTARTSASLADVSDLELAGVWTNGGGLAGNILYLFPDRTYIYTEWADIQPETIYDKGHWQVAGGVLLMRPDADVFWTPRSDRRYLCLESGQQGLLLLGIDLAVGWFTELAEEHPEIATPVEWLQATALKREKRLNGRDGRLLKTSLLKRSWRPDYFEDQR